MARKHCPREHRERRIARRDTQLARPGGRAWRAGRLDGGQEASPRAGPHLGGAGHSGKRHGLVHQEDDEDPKQVFQFKKAHRTEFSVSAMCRVLRVSRGDFYGWLTRSTSRLETADWELLEQIRRIHAEFPGNYEAPRIQAALIYPRSDYRNSI